MKTINELDIEKKIRQRLKGSLKINQSLRDYTSIKIGGEAELFIEPLDSSDLSYVLKVLNSSAIPMRVIGNGTNLIITDEVIPAAVIKLSAPFFKQISRISEDTVFARAGKTLNGLLEFSAQLGLSGLEFLAGIPGSVGGALVMNAGIRNLKQDSIKPYLNIGDAVTKIEVMDKNGEIFDLDKAEAGFRYRGSNLKGHIILGAYFKLKLKTEKEIKASVEEFLKKRQKNSAYYAASAGCIFKNPNGEKQSAGYLIENSGLKGLCVGDAQVSKEHANFIINKRNASFEQVCELISLIQKKVFQDSRIMLELEVDLWGK